MIKWMRRVISSPGSVGYAESGNLSMLSTGMVRDRLESHGIAGIARPAIIRLMRVGPKSIDLESGWNNMGYRMITLERTKRDLYKDKIRLYNVSYY